MNASLLWLVQRLGLPGDVTINFTDEQKWNLIRNYRTELLSRCDWTQLPDVALSLEEKQLWGTYRQTLRDITEDFATPDEVIFPTEPGGER